MQRRIERTKKAEPSKGEAWSGSEELRFSTGSTLLDLAISGGRFPGGGIPAGIMAEIFGPPGSGKTAMLAQIAANAQHAGFKAMYLDPEARLNPAFAQTFGLRFDDVIYAIPNTVAEAFRTIRQQLDEDESVKVICADSLAALSTELEMGSEEGDKMGMRRAKEFSEELRRTCRLITTKKVLLICSNQIRQNLDAGPYGQRYKSPGGEAIGFYSSLRLRCGNIQKLIRERSIRGRTYKRVVGVDVTVDVFKSSVWKPYREADVIIVYDYGIDDIRANLQFLKTASGSTVYTIGERKLSRSMDEAIRIVEAEGLEQELRQEVIDVWTELEQTFEEPRKPREW